MRVRVVPAVVLAASIGGFIGGCALVLGFDDTRLRDDLADAGIDAAPDGSADAGSPLLTASPTSLVVRRGGTLAVQVSLQRGSIAGPVIVRLEDLPANVTAEPLTLADGQSSGVVTLTASLSAPLGASTARLRADQPAFATVDLPLLVADAAGSLDSTFDQDGLVIDATKGLTAVFYAGALQADGKIVAAGVAGAPGGWMVRRFGPGGAPDTAFTTALTGLPIDGELRALAIDAGGKIIAVGSSVPLANTPAQLTVVRLNANGSLDPTFAGGVVRLSAGDGLLGSTAYAVAIQNDGAIVVAGSRKETVTDEAGVLLRLKADGTRDTTFGGGLVVVKKNRFVGVSAETSGIVVAGTDTAGTLTSYTLARYQRVDGALDKTFGVNGTSAFGLGFRADGFARMPNGSFALVGESTLTGDPKYTAGLATPAGSQVWTRATAPGTGAQFHGAIGQADGRLVAAGFTPAAQSEARVDRVLADGGRDDTFGDAGSSLIEVKATTAFDVSLWAALVQPDGRIVVFGNRSNAGAVIYRLWP